MRHDGRVLHRSHEGIAQALRGLHFLECLLLLVRVALIQHGLGVLGSKPGLFRQLASPAARHHVSQTHGRFRHADGTLQCGDADIASGAQ